jgi:hypothetical protein
MMDQIRLSRFVEAPNLKEKERFNYNINLKSAGKEEDV